MQSYSHNASYIIISQEPQREILILSSCMHLMTLQKLNFVTKLNVKLCKGQITIFLAKFI